MAHDRSVMGNLDGTTQTTQNGLVIKPSDRTNKKRRKRKKTRSITISSAYEESLCESDDSSSLTSTSPSQFPADLPIAEKPLFLDASKVLEMSQNEHTNTDHDLSLLDGRTLKENKYQVLKAIQTTYEECNENDKRKIAAVLECGNEKKILFHPLAFITLSSDEINILLNQLKQLKGMFWETEKSIADRLNEKLAPCKSIFFDENGFKEDLKNIASIKADKNDEAALVGLEADLIQLHRDKINFINELLIKKTSEREEIIRELVTEEENAFQQKLFELCYDTLELDAMDKAQKYGKLIDLYEDFDLKDQNNIEKIIVYFELFFVKKSLTNCEEENGKTTLQLSLLYCNAMNESNIARLKNEIQILREMTILKSEVEKIKSFNDDSALGGLYLKAEPGSPQHKRLSSILNDFEACYQHGSFDMERYKKNQSRFKVLINYALINRSPNDVGKLKIQDNLLNQTFLPVIIMLEKLEGFEKDILNIEIDFNLIKNLPDDKIREFKEKKLIVQKKIKDCINCLHYSLSELRKSQKGEASSLEIEAINILKVHRMHDIEERIKRIVFLMEDLRINSNIFSRTKLCELEIKLNHLPDHLPDLNEMIETRFSESAAPSQELKLNEFIAERKKSLEDYITNRIWYKKFLDKALFDFNTASCKLNCTSNVETDIAVIETIIESTINYKKKCESAKTEYEINCQRISDLIHFVNEAINYKKLLNYIPLPNEHHQSTKCARTIEITLIYNQLVIQKKKLATADFSSVMDAITLDHFKDDVNHFNTDVKKLIELINIDLTATTVKDSLSLLKISVSDSTSKSTFRAKKIDQIRNDLLIQYKHLVTTEYFKITNRDTLEEYINKVDKFKESINQLNNLIAIDNKAIEIKKLLSPKRLFDDASLQVPNYDDPQAWAIVTKNKVDPKKANIKILRKNLSSLRHSIENEFSNITDIDAENELAQFKADIESYNKMIQELEKEVCEFNQYLTKKLKVRMTKTGKFESVDSKEKNELTQLYLKIKDYIEQAENNAHLNCPFLFPDKTPSPDEMMYSIENVHQWAKQESRKSKYFATKIDFATEIDKCNDFEEIQRLYSLASLHKLKDWTNPDPAERKTSYQLALSNSPDFISFPKLPSLGDRVLDTIKNVSLIICGALLTIPGLLMPALLEVGLDWFNSGLEAMNTQTLINQQKTTAKQLHFAKTRGAETNNPHKLFFPKIDIKTRGDDIPPPSARTQHSLSSHSIFTKNTTASTSLVHDDKPPLNFEKYTCC